MVDKTTQTTVKSVEEKIADKISVKINFLKKAKYFEDDKEERNIYNIIVEYDEHKCSFKFGDSIANMQEGKKPTKEDILETICSDYNYTNEYYPTFHDFAEEFGYDSDSIKAEKTYKKCMKQGADLHYVFDGIPDTIEKLRQEIED